MKLPLREFSDIVNALRPMGGNPAAAENRSATRISVTAKLNAHTLEGSQIKRSYSLFSRDISLTGMGMFQTIALPIGSEMIVELPRKAGPLYVRSVVARCHPLADGILGVGIEFTSMADATIIAQLVQGKGDQLARMQRAIME